MLIRSSLGCLLHENREPLQDLVICPVEVICLCLSIMGHANTLGVFRYHAAPDPYLSESTLRQLGLAGTFYAELNLFSAGQWTDITVGMDPIDPLLQGFLRYIPLDKEAIVGY